MASFQYDKINQPIQGETAIVQRLKALLNTEEYQLPLSTFGIDSLNPDKKAAIVEKITVFFPDLEIESVEAFEGTIEVFVTINNQTINVRN